MLGELVKLANVCSASKPDLWLRRRECIVLTAVVVYVRIFTLQKVLVPPNAHACGRCCTTYVVVRWAFRYTYSELWVGVDP